MIQAMQTISPTALSVFALALVYRVSTRFRPRWKDIWPGTLSAALALSVLVWGYGLYVRHYGSSSADHRARPIRLATDQADAADATDDS